MKVRNTTQRNIRLLAAYEFATDPDTGEVVKPESGRPQLRGLPYKVLVPAGSTLELGDKDWAKVSISAKKLLDLGYLVFKQAPESPLTKAQIIARVKVAESIDLDPKMSKDRLVSKAEKLDVDIWSPEVVEEVSEAESEDSE